jgi:neutral trehalase
VQDVLFNALLCQANRDLAEVACILGEDPAAFEEWAQKTARAIESKLWDEEHGIYVDFDLVAGQQIYAYVAANFTPHYSPLCGHLERSSGQTHGRDDGKHGIWAGSKGLLPYT